MGNTARWRISLNDSVRRWRGPQKVCSNHVPALSLMSPRVSMCRSIRYTRLANFGFHGMRIQLAGELSPSAPPSRTNVTNGAPPGNGSAGARWPTW